MFLSVTSKVLHRQLVRKCFCFPNEPLRRKQWVHAIRREEGSNFKITGSTKVCSLHFRAEDLRKSLNGRIYVSEGGIPSKFSWSIPSPRKRRAPTLRQPSQQQKRKKVKEPITEDINLPESAAVQQQEHVSNLPDNVVVVETRNNDVLYVKTLEEKLAKLQHEIEQLRDENSSLKERIAEQDSYVESCAERLFQFERFKSDSDINFYTGLANYEVFDSVYKFLDPGDNCKNIRPRRSTVKVSDDLYDSDNSDDEEVIIKKGPQRKLKPVEELFLTLCRLRRGFSERHLANLYAIDQSTVSRIIIAWVNYMYLKFGQICIWPSQSTVKETMPDDFKEKFPSTRVIIDCTEVFCEMPSSLLLNSELFSSYKNHVTLKGLVGIAPSGAITFISQLYTGSISDREIVERSGFLAQQFDQTDSVMADKGFTIEDLLPLGVSLNIPPFLGSNEQMSAEDVIKTQTIASLRIHVERAINKIKNYRIWQGIVPISYFGVVNQMWSICAFMCNLQEPLISS